jgi:hypothetical protein
MLIARNRTRREKDNPLYAIGIAEFTHGAASQSVQAKARHVDVIRITK